jgi:hypothetical protein
MMTIDTLDFICLDSSDQADNLVVQIEGGIGSGSVTWRGNGIVDSLTGRFDPAIAGLGQHLIECVFEEDNCIWRATTIIEVRLTPISSFTLDTAICLDSFALLKFDGQASLSATTDLFTDGGFAFPISGSFDREINWTTSGDKIVRLILQDNGCESLPYEQIIRVDEPIDSLNITCLSFRQSVEIIIHNYGMASNYLVTSISGHSYTISNDSIVVLDGLIPGEEIIIEVTALSGNTCDDVIKVIQCSALDCPALSFDIEDDPMLCSNEIAGTYTIDFKLTGSTSNGTFNWTGNGVLDSEKGEIDIENLSPGVYQYIVTYNEDGCSYTDSINIEINEAPVANAGPDLLLTCRDSVFGMPQSRLPGLINSWSPNPQTVSSDSIFFSEEGSYKLTTTDTATGCSAVDELVISREQDIPSDIQLEVVSVGCDTMNDFGSITITGVIGGITPLSYSLDGVSYGMATMFNNLVPGSYRVWIKDANDCILSKDAEVKKGQPVTVDLGPDREIYFGDIVQLHAMVNRPVISITWNPNTDLNCVDCLSPAIRPDSTILLTIKVIDEDGCVATDEVLITVKYKKVFIPNSFSPNGDQLNDRLTIFGSQELNK